jgi:hypothetical protein
VVGTSGADRRSDLDCPADPRQEPDLNFLKGCRLIRYMPDPHRVHPARKSEQWKKPASSVEIPRKPWRFGDVTVTSAPTIGAPVTLNTDPSRFPVVLWAKTAMGTKRIRRTMAAHLIVCPKFGQLRDLICAGSLDLLVVQPNPPQHVTISRTGPLKVP